MAAVNEAGLVHEQTDDAWSMPDMILARHLGLVVRKNIRPTIARAIQDGAIVPRSRRAYDACVPTAWFDIGTVGKGKANPGRGTSFRLNQAAAIFMCGRVPATKAAVVMTGIASAFACPTRHEATPNNDTEQEQPMAKKIQSNVLALPNVSTLMPEERESLAALSDQEIVMVTPELAAKWLDVNYINQRPVNAVLVARFAADMKAGRWCYNGAPVKFSKEGFLIDGQHRLTAIRLSGASAPMLVVRHHVAVEMNTIDAGRSRTAGDSLVMAGLTDRGCGKNSAACASALKRGADCVTIQIGHAAVASVYLAHKEGIDFATSSLPQATAPIRAAIAYIYPALSMQVGAFTERIRTNVGIQPESGEQALSLLMRSKVATTDGERHALFYRAMYAIQASCEGRKIKVLKKPQEGAERPTCLTWADRKREAKSLLIGSGDKRDE